MKRYAVLLTSVVLLSACGGTAGTGSTAEPTGPATVAATATPMPASVTPTPSASSTAGGSMTPEEKAAALNKPEVHAAVNDLVTKKGADATKVEVVSYDRVEWSDGSMGCPNPDKMYIQALQEGRHLVLTADGKQYSYHGGKTGDLMLCEKPTPPARVLADK